MKRRGFFASLFGIAAAPVVLDAVVDPETEKYVHKQLSIEFGGLVDNLPIRFEYDLKQSEQDLREFFQKEGNEFRSNNNH